MLDEDCKGCVNYSDHLKGCLLIYDNSTCPCKQCLVKSMCNTTCELWQSFRINDLHNDHINSQVKRLRL